MKLNIKREGKHYILEELPDPKFYLDVANEETPCDGCIHAQTCGKKRLACYAFGLYVATGQVDWQMPRSPSRRTYARAVWFEDASLTREINNIRKELQNDNAY
jgi:hypothetical protein